MTWEGWTEPCLDQLRTLWAEGCTATEIQATIGAVSRSAVLGKIHRLGLIGPRTWRVKIMPPKPPPKPPVAVAVVPEAPVPRTIDGQPVTLENCGANDCRWPYGDPWMPEFHLCGQPREEGSSYCPHHHGKATTRIRGVFTVAA